MTSLPTRQLPQNPSRTTPFSEPWLRSLAKAVGSVGGKPTLMSGVHPTAQQVRAVQDRLSGLRNLVASEPDRQQVAVELAKLLAAFPAQDQSDAPAELRMAAYFEALEGVPAWAAGEARGKVMRGEAGIDMRFAPTPPQFAATAKNILEPLRRDLAKLEQVATAIEADRDNPSEAEQARVAEGFAALKADMRPSRTAHQVYEDAMAGLQRHARENGVDFETAFAAVPDAPVRNGTFGKL